MKHALVSLAAFFALALISLGAQVAPAPNHGAITILWIHPVTGGGNITITRIMTTTMIMTTIITKAIMITTKITSIMIMTIMTIMTMIMITIDRTKGAIGSKLG